MPNKPRPDFMPRKPTGRPTGRPYLRAYDQLSKVCERCGRRFFLRDRPFQSRARFERRRFCSHSCVSGGPTPQDLRERLLSKIAVNTLSQCWEWQGKLMHKGYGTLSLNNKTVRAHRAAYEVFVGPIPEGEVIMHLCDNRRCINPEHLRAGTFKDNFEDAMRKGRMPQIGRANSRRRIVGDYTTGTLKEAAERLGVSQTTIWNYRRRDAAGGAA